MLSLVLETVILKPLEQALEKHDILMNALMNLFVP